MDEQKLIDLAKRYEIAENGDSSRCADCGDILLVGSKGMLYTERTGSGNCTWHGGAHGYYTSHSRGYIGGEGYEDPESLIAAIIDEILKGVNDE